jgi:hypothetical protein
MHTNQFSESRCIAGLALAALLTSGAAAQESFLITANEEWVYLKGTAPPPEGWTEPGFDDSSWLSGPTGIGYADGDDITLIDDMLNTYTSIVARKTFEVSNPGSVSGLVLRIRYDDGFIAYLNGTEVARSANMAGAAGPQDYTFLPTPDHEAGAVGENFEIDEGFLDVGENVLAIQVHNTSLTSSDFSFIPELVTNADLCPQVFSCRFDSATQSVILDWTNRAAYDSISLSRDGSVIDGAIPGTVATYTDFSAPFGSISYSLTATHNGNACVPLECSVTTFSQSAIAVNQGEIWKFWRGSSPPPFDWYLEGIDDDTWEEGPTGIGYGDGDDATVLDDMMMVAGGAPGYLAVYLRKEFSVSSLEGVSGLLSITYDDGFIAYVNGQEIGRVNMPADPVNEQTPAVVAGDPTQATIPIPPGVLRVGANLIAIAVHNAGLTSSDLTAIPIVALPGGAGGSSFRRGDVDSSGFANVTDAVSLLNHLFQGAAGPPCPDAADVTDDGLLNITDAVVLLNHLFLGAPEPPAPGLGCGPDPTPDTLGDCSTMGC